MIAFDQAERAERPIKFDDAMRKAMRVSPPPSGKKAKKKVSLEDLFAVDATLGRPAASCAVVALVGRRQVQLRPQCAGQARPHHARQGGAALGE